MAMAKTSKNGARSRGPSWDPSPVEVDKLHLDPLNPRLAEYGLNENAAQPQILQVLWKEMAVDEIALSISANGYFPFEPLFAEKRDGKLWVIEGNRRLAAVKVLRDEKLRDVVRAHDLPRLTQGERSKLDVLPVIECSRGDLWRYLGFKHVNGPQNWESYAKAEYIAWVHNELGKPLEEIAQTIGDKHSTVTRLYNGVQTLAQAEKNKVFEREDRWKNHFSFSHLYTGLGYDGIREFLGLKDADLEKKEPVPKAHIKELGELCLWLFGSKSKEAVPVVQSQNPDLRQLDEAIKSTRGLSAIRSGLPLRVALDISRGDDRRFRESLVEAKEKLQLARGTLLTGYQGEPDLLNIAKEAKVLLDAIVAEMHEHKGGSSKASRPARR
ncbi:MAG: hypothetical protein U0270_20015 [Labilithrix sp.]